MRSHKPTGNCNDSGLFQTRWMASAEEVFATKEDPVNSNITGIGEKRLAECVIMRWRIYMVHIQPKMEIIHGILLESLLEGADT